MRRTKKQTRELREIIVKLREQDFSFPEIAEMLKLKSAALVAYHYKESEKVESQTNKSL